MSRKFINETNTIAAPRRANDFLIHPKRFRMPEPLFDEFWREGELAMLFGPPSSGKSIFALQLGDGLSRGGGLPGFRHPRGRRRVLYADLRHTDDQFQMRCADAGVRHRFPRNLFRDRPPALEQLCEWLIDHIKANKVQVVIIDDISVVKNTHDGTRETLKLMRRLREIREKTGISILVIAGSEPPTRGTVSENDLGRSRVLCSVADSVFAIGRSLRHVGDHYLIQTRARNAPIFWTEQNAPAAQVFRTPTGLLAFKFDERFGEQVDDKKRRLICEVSRLSMAEGKTFREIAAQLGISKSWACTLFKKWTPAMEEGLYDIDEDREDDWDEELDGDEDEYEDESDDDDDDEDEDEDGSDDDFSGEFAEPNSDANELKPSGGDWLTGIDPRNVPFAAALARRWIRDLERDLDGYGREIFVETRREHDGKPLIWYSQNPKTAHYTRHERGLYGINLKNIGSSGAIPDPNRRAVM